MLFKLGRHRPRTAAPQTPPTQPQPDGNPSAARRSTNTAESCGPRPEPVRHAAPRTHIKTSPRGLKPSNTASATTHNTPRPTHQHPPANTQTPQPAKHNPQHTAPSAALALIFDSRRHSPPNTAHNTPRPTHQHPPAKTRSHDPPDTAQSTPPQRITACVRVVGSGRSASVWRGFCPHHANPCAQTRAVERWRVGGGASAHTTPTPVCGWVAGAAARRC